MSTSFFGRSSVHLDPTAAKPPHLFSTTHTRGRVWLKIAALLPLVIMACVAQGWPVLRALGVCVCGSLLAEVLGSVFFLRKPAFDDGESVFIGLFCALILPLTLPSWVFFAAAFSAVFFGREIWGGFGQALIFPPAVGVLILFLSLPQLIQAFDFKEARALALALPLNTGGHLNVMNLFFYPASAAPEGVSLVALVVGFGILLAGGLVRWELPLLCMVGMSGVRVLLEKNEAVFLFSGGLWLTLFWGLAQTSAMPLTSGGRRLYALLAGLLAAVCPLGDEALRMLAGFAAASLIAPWLDTILMLPRTPVGGTA